VQVAESHHLAQQARSVSNKTLPFVRRKAMKSMTKLGPVVAMFVIVGPAALTQPQSGGMPAYDTSTEVKIAGTIQDVIHPQRGRGWHGTGTHLLMKTEGGTFDVHLGPSSYISSQGFAFFQGRCRRDPWL
jgi:hypothetical protein